MENKYPTYRGVPYKPDENGIALEVLCPLVNDWVEDIDCMENQVLRPESIPDKFKQKPNWREICNQCPFQDY